MRSVLRRLPILLALLPAAARAQGGAPGAPATVAPGPEYEASGLKEQLLGDDYRDAWVAPVTVPTLDLRRFAGGLRPTERGGGLQTRSLRFEGADGREYAFRSVNKYPHLTKEPSLRDTPVGQIIQDQVSSILPAAGLIVPPLAQALGIPHVTPQLFLMPDDPALGEFRSEFAGMLGTVEERPDEPGEGRRSFGGFARIVSTPRLLERLEESSEDRIDARAYLTARLLDMFINDWDRHEDQWRWGQRERDGIRWWEPIPRDRDYAFVDYDGLLMQVGRSFAPNAVLFDGRYNITGLTLNARSLDRRLLGSLDRAAWDSVGASVQQRLTDAVIDDAVSRLPAPHRAVAGEKVSRTLKLRRDNLPDAVRRFYAMVATEVDLYGTDDRDLAVVDRAADGVVRVRLWRTAGDGVAQGEPYLDRAFRTGETREIRLYLQGANDRALVRGDVRESLVVRVIGGGDDDLFTDSSRVSSERKQTAFYDFQGENRFEATHRTVVDTREYEPPARAQNLRGESYRDWGSLRGTLPLLGYQFADGPVIGVAPTFTRFGFRNQPYKYLLGARGMVGLGTGAVHLEAVGDFRRIRPSTGYAFRLLGTQLDPLRFHGLGNDTRTEQPNRFYVVRQNRLLASGSAYYGLPGRGRFAVGPVVKYTRTQVPPGTPFEAAHEGERGFGQLGAHTELQFDRRNEILYPRHGALVQVGATAYPAVWSAAGPFGEAHGTVSTYVSPSSIPLRPTLALRAGGQHVWGDFPVHEAAYLGGAENLRGYGTGRYAGDGLLFGNAELRVPLGQVKHLVRGDLGVLGLVDAGRVYLDGESPGGWHTAAGGGLWFRFRIRDSLMAASALYAQGEDAGRLYIHLGVPF